MNMPVLYTETFSTLLENQKYNTPEQSLELTNILEKFAKFPNFVYENLDLNMWDLFKEKYDIREIGSETENLFLHFLNEKINENLIIYVPKIKMWLSNFASLFEFTVNIKTSDKNKYSSGSQDTMYLNPVNAKTGITKEIIIDENTGKTTINYSGGNLKVQNIDTNDNNGETIREINTQRLQAVWGKTRADIMKSILELQDIYLDCLNSFEEIFMGVY